MVLKPLSLVSVLEQVVVRLDRSGWTQCVDPKMQDLGNTDRLFVSRDQLGHVTQCSKDRLADDG